MKKQWRVLFLAAAAAVVMSTGCGNSASTQTTAATTAAETTAAETTAAEAKTEEDIDWQYVDGKDAVAAVGSDDVQFLDVRDDDTYAQGHLKGSLQCGLKDFESADAQKAMYELAQTMDSSKPVYILCYSGNKCAKTAIAVMKDAGFDTNELFIIKDGAKGKDVAAALVTE